MRSLIRSISYFLHSDPAASRLAIHRRSDMRRTAKTSSSWASAIERGDNPAYLAIADAIAAHIDTGALTANQRLTTLRVLARELDPTFTTVARAYPAARRRRLIAAPPPRGRPEQRRLGDE